MVCPVCIIPLISGATAIGTGSKVFSKKSPKTIKYVFLLITIGLVSISVYFVYHKKKLSEDCDTCKIDYEDNK